MMLLDISRLIGRASRLTPSGIDRVELAYARNLLAGTSPRCFVRTDFLGRLAALPHSVVERYVNALEALWGEGPNWRRRARVRWMAMRLRCPRRYRCRTSAVSMSGNADNPVYLLVSHHHLEKRQLITRLKRQHGFFLICLIHDLIPIEFPEFARPGHDRRHHRRIETAVTLADAMIVPSAATAAALRREAGERRTVLRIVVAPFGNQPPTIQATAAVLPQRPYFVCLGTIEPRKNHLLLLNLWRDLVARYGCNTPQLLLVGRRGWEIENAIDLLERCPSLRGIMVEYNRASDADSQLLLKHARALLFPSFAEGFGFPVVEALALGTPVLCSDIRALREVGGDVPEYLDPLDGAAWRAAVLDYTEDRSPRRAAQLQRLTDWQPPRWSDHFAAVEALVGELTVASAAIVAKLPPTGGRRGGA